MSCPCAASGSGPPSGGGCCGGGGGAKVCPPAQLTPAEVAARAQELKSHAPLMLFIKGNFDDPRCRFSRAMMHLLVDNGVAKFGFFDILEDPQVGRVWRGVVLMCDVVRVELICLICLCVCVSVQIRAYLKEHGHPTFPQVYLGGQLLGGLDEMKAIVPRSVALLGKETTSTSSDEGDSNSTLSSSPSSSSPSSPSSSSSSSSSTTADAAVLPKELFADVGGAFKATLLVNQPGVVLFVDSGPAAVPSDAGGQEVVAWLEAQALAANVYDLHYMAQWGASVKAAVLERAQVVLDDDVKNPEQERELPQLYVDRQRVVWNEGEWKQVLIEYKQAKDADKLQKESQKKKKEEAEESAADATAEQVASQQ
jgi:glutaredoxin-related protein